MNVLLHLPYCNKVEKIHLKLSLWTKEKHNELIVISESRQQTNCLTCRLAGRLLPHRATQPILKIMLFIWPQCWNNYSNAKHNYGCVVPQYSAILLFAAEPHPRLMVINTNRLRLARRSHTHMVFASPVITESPNCHFTCNSDWFLQGVTKCFRYKNILPAIKIDNSITSMLVKSSKGKLPNISVS